MLVVTLPAKEIKYCQKQEGYAEYAIYPYLSANDVCQLATAVLRAAKQQPDLAENQTIIQLKEAFTQVSTVEARYRRLSAAHGALNRLETKRERFERKKYAITAEPLETSCLAAASVFSHPKAQNLIGIDEVEQRLVNSKVEPDAIQAVMAELKGCGSVAAHIAASALTAQKMLHAGSLGTSEEHLVAIEHASSNLGTFARVFRPLLKAKIDATTQERDRVTRKHLQPILRDLRFSF